MSTLSIVIPLILIGLVLLVVAVWLLMRINTKTTVVGDDDSGDVLDKGATPAKRNQALIDAPAAVEPKASVPQPETAPEPAPVPTAEPTAAPTPAPAPTPAAPAASDDLSQIKGVGPKLVAMLQDEGVTSFAQIAAWTDSDIEAIDAKLGRFKGRITRDQWVDQAKLLISDDKSAFSEKFGNNG